MKRFLMFSLAIFTAITAFAQAEKKPTIMVLPSAHWCTSRYFTTQFNNQGKTITINDYDLAYRQDNELPAVTAKVGEILASYGYILKDYVQEKRSVDDRHAEDEVTMNRNGGMLEESPIDILRRVVKYDIEVAVDWDIVGIGSEKAVSFTIEAFDTYTSKRIATATGISKSSDAIIEKQIESAIVKYIPRFTKQLDAYFSSLKKEGREIRLTVRVWETSDYNLETEFDGEELLDCIQDWMSGNTVKGVFNLSDATENRANFEQVRIPFFNEKGRAMDARAFGTNLRKFLAQSPYCIPSKVMQRGLGEVIVVIGDR